MGSDGFENLPVIFAVLAAMPRTDPDVEGRDRFRREIGERIDDDDERHVVRAVAEGAVELTGRRARVRGRAADFLRACVAELRRVQWPDRRQVGQGTAVVIGFVVVAGVYLGVLDAIWNPIVQAII